MAALHSHNFRLDVETIRLLDELQADLGLSTRVDALRVAVRLAARRNPPDERLALARVAGDVEREEKRERAARSARRRPARK